MGLGSGAGGAKRRRPLVARARGSSWPTSAAPGPCRPLCSPPAGPAPTARHAGINARSTTPTRDIARAPGRLRLGRARATACPAAHLPSPLPPLPPAPLGREGVERWKGLPPAFAGHVSGPLASPLRPPSAAPRPALPQRLPHPSTPQVLSNGEEVRLQRNALTVLEPPTGDETARKKRAGGGGWAGSSGGAAWAQAVQGPPPPST